MAEKEAKARIKINRLLEEAGWRFFDSKAGKANILLENNVKITESTLNELGENFEKIKKGFADFLLLDEKGFPLIVLEAKAEDKNPLFGKEQARKYAMSQNCRFVILSNGNLHYFWDLEKSNPGVISSFPSPAAAGKYSEFRPDRDSLIRESVSDDYIVLTQKPEYRSDPSFKIEKTKKEFIENNKLRFLRKYQVKAVQSIQKAVKDGKDRFLFEMATGTGKTLVSAAVIKLFLRTGNARRVLFLVDRLELEDQAWKAFVSYLKNDYKTVIYKDNRDDWHKAEIVVSTVQTFISKNRYKRLFSPDDFDLVISDEAHRSIGGVSRSVFEYFIGYKLGLTATPKDYLKNINKSDLRENDPRELERRLLLDSYKTFGCENGEPTFRYSLLEGVKDGFLINPAVADARTEITVQLLADEGYSVSSYNDDGEETEETFIQKDFEKKFFSENTNIVFCRTFLENALRDPITGEIGKTIVFCVSQNHAAKITQILNVSAHQMFPGRYNSDFAVQVTSRISDAQQFTVNFTNNKLSGTGNFNPLYKTSKTRVCVTVGMMTTGYDCPDILNICLMRPIFSPTDFIQIKGRGTRKHNFSEEIIDPALRIQAGERNKTVFKIFDFFANCEYFEEKFSYDEILQIPKEMKKGKETGGGGGTPVSEYISKKIDVLVHNLETHIGPEGMKIDRMYFDRFEKTVSENSDLKQYAEAGRWDEMIKYVEQNIFDKPQEYFNLTRLRAAIQSDRRISLQEILEKIFGMIPYFKSKNELLEDEFEKFDSRYLPQEEYFHYAKSFFKAYILDSEFREIIDKADFSYLNVSPYGEDFRQLSPELRKLIPEYIKDFISLNQFMG